MSKLQNWSTARKIFLLLLAVAAIGATGCAKRSPMQNLGPTALHETANADDSIIVFFSPAKQHRLHIPIVEMDESGNPSLVTILVPGTKYLHRTTPGNHLYFLSTTRGRSEMLEATMEPGKVYYTRVARHPNSRDSEQQSEYFNAYEFVPVPNAGDGAVTEDLALCRWYHNTPRAAQWYERNLPDLKKRAVEAHIRHQGDGSKKMIKPEYGTTLPVR